MKIRYVEGPSYAYPERFEGIECLDEFGKVVGRIDRHDLYRLGHGRGFLRVPGKGFRRPSNSAQMLAGPYNLGCIWGNDSGRAYVLVRDPGALRRRDGIRIQMLPLLFPLPLREGEKHGVIDGAFLRDFLDAADSLDREREVGRYLRPFPWYVPDLEG